MADETKEDQSEAVYFSALASLDELSDYQQRFSVVINWVKYIMLHRIEQLGPGEHIGRYVKAYASLCSSFAATVMELPDKYIDCILREMEEAGIGPDEVLCEQCLAEKAEENGLDN